MRKSIMTLIIGLVALVLLIGVKPVSHALAQEKDPGRETWITADITAYDWLLVKWADNSVGCNLTIDHEGVPTTDEIKKNCNETVYHTWLTTPACKVTGGTANLKFCPGYYLQHTAMRQIQSEIAVEIAKPEIQVTFPDCTPDGAVYKCQGQPMLLLIGVEPLPNESITSISGEYATRSFSCEGSECLVTLDSTSEQGLTLTFWGVSSYGDSTEEFTAYIRVIHNLDAPSGEDGSPGQGGYTIEAVSPQVHSEQTYTCAGIWQAYPSMQSGPDWLSTPSDASGLSSSLPLHFLAAMLIHNGAADASGCPGGGLENLTTANLCGVEKAADALNAWQNQFDEEIMLTSAETGVPAQLLKNIFARESQLWPGIYSTIEEVGFGQLTHKGAETALLWNPDFYNQFCPLVLAQDTCDKGYSNLPRELQAVLRGALTQRANATCPDCPMGINLTHANFSIKIFGELITGNCAQVDRMIYNLTSQASGRISSYADLWRFTVVNYNAGPGCLSSALSRTRRAGHPLDWVHVAANLDPICRLAVDYLEDITEGDTPSIPFYNTPPPEIPATPTSQLTPSGTATPMDGQPTTTPTPYGGL